MTRIAPIVVIGPSGAGKSTLVKKLVEQDVAVLHPTVTTRPRRGSDDTTHVFVSIDEFKQLQKSNRLIGASKMFGHWYALPELADSTLLPTIVLLRAVFVDEFRRYYPDAIVVQVEASVETLQDRLKRRGDLKRADPDQLRQEIEYGRTLADHVVDTTNSPQEAMEVLEKLCMIS